MSATIKIAGWLLFSVMHDGTTSTANFPTEALCKDGASIVMYGETVAEKKVSDMKAEAQGLVNQALWERDHPPSYMSPTGYQFYEDQVRKAKQEGKPIFLGGACGGGPCTNSYALPDGRIKNVTEPQGGFFGGPSPRARESRCFPVPSSEG